MNKRHNNRRFNKASYIQNDARAKDALIIYLNSEGYTDIESQENFYFDIHSKNKDTVELFEVEIIEENSSIDKAEAILYICGACFLEKGP